MHEGEEGNEVRTEEEKNRQAGRKAEKGRQAGRRKKEGEGRKLRKVKKDALDFSCLAVNCGGVHCTFLWRKKY
jgi:hypothetical protein